MGQLSVLETVGLRLLVDYDIEQFGELVLRLVKVVNVAHHVLDYCLDVLLLFNGNQVHEFMAVDLVGGGVGDGEMKVVKDLVHRIITD